MLVELAVFKHFNQSDHSIHGGANFMAHGGQKGGLGSVGVLSLISSKGQCIDHGLLFTHIVQGTGKHGLTVDLIFANCQFQWYQVTILVLANHFTAGADEIWLPCFHVTGQVTIMAAAVRIWHQRRNILTDQLIRSVTEYGLYCRVGTVDQPFVVDGNHALHQIVEQSVQLGFLGLNGVVLELNFLHLLIEQFVHLLKLFGRFMTFSGVMCRGKD